MGRFIFRRILELMCCFAFKILFDQAGPQVFPRQPPKRPFGLPLASGPWSLVPGPWSLVPGPWSLVLGPWSLVPGPWVRPWSLVPGTMCLDLGT